MINVAIFGAAAILGLAIAMTLRAFGARLSQSDVIDIVVVAILVAAIVIGGWRS